LLIAIALSASAVQCEEVTVGRGAAANSRSADSEMAWGIALGALAVVGVVVGIVASAASQTKTH
jgi:hypothetical protein